MSFILQLAAEKSETCKMTVVTSKGQQTVVYGSLKKAIGHNDLFQRACSFYNTSAHIAFTLSRMENV